MSETLQMWLFGAGAAAIVTMFGLWIRHTRDCEVQRIGLAKALQELKSDHDRLFDEVGRTHNSGLRLRMHRVENVLSREDRGQYP